MVLRIRDILVQTAEAMGLFRFCLLLSLGLHLLAYGSYFLATLPYGREVSSDEIKIEDVDVDFTDIPPRLLGGESDPAPVEKQEWIEGTSKTAPDALDEELNVNALSGTGTDKEGYLFSFNGDRPPTPIIDFDLKQFFPKEARWANITQKVVVVRVQVDERGRLVTARVVSAKAGYGFDEAAIKIVNLAKFAPGYQKGRPVKMNHRLPITFLLED
jgi:periplasmic protein TonB